MHLRPYQIPIFTDNTTGILGLHWARQLGKSTLLAAWAVDRLLTRPGRLVTVLSNCQQNGVEFSEKCQAICAEHGAAFESEARSVELADARTTCRCDAAWVIVGFGTINMAVLRTLFSRRLTQVFELKS
jgi:hypothetical protein